MARQKATATRVLRGEGRWRDVDTVDLLRELSQRGGAPGMLGRAGLVAEMKARDYNDGLSRDSYFPLGLQSYAQMLHVKVQRLLSFAKKPRGAVHEGVLDTALDLVNYASFTADWMAREDEAQKILHDGDAKRLRRAA